MLKPLNSDESKNIFKWKTGDNPGFLGYELYDKYDAILAKRLPSMAELGDSNGITTLKQIESIKFVTDSGDGFVGKVAIVDEMTGERVSFTCIDCDPSSPSTTLGLLYLDIDQNGDQNMTGFSNCAASCTFTRGNPFPF